MKGSSSRDNLIDIRISPAVVVVVLVLVAAILAALYFTVFVQHRPAAPAAAEGEGKVSSGMAPTPQPAAATAPDPSPKPGAAGGLTEVETKALTPATPAKPPDIAMP